MATARPLVQRFAQRVAPLGAKVKPARRSWTNLRRDATYDLNRLGALEKSVQYELDRFNKLFHEDVGQHMLDATTDTPIEHALDSLIPEEIAVLFPHLIDILTQLFHDALAESAAYFLEHNALLSESAISDLEENHEAQVEAAHLEGQRLLSETNRITPPPNLPAAPFGFSGDASAWFNLKLDLVNPYAVQYAQQSAIRLAGVLEQTTLDSVRDTIAFGYEHSWTVEMMRDQIVGKVGLFPKWSRAVDNRYQGMLDAGMDAKFARKQADIYAGQLRKKRAMMIARTETMRASNFGRLAAWHAMGAAGLLDVHLSTKKWMTGPHVAQSAKVDRRVTGPCDICGPMDGVEVQGVDGLFMVDGVQMAAPPAHPHCRCTVLIVPPAPPTWEEMGGQVQWLQDPNDPQDSGT